MVECVGPQFRPGRNVNDRIRADGNIRQVDHDGDITAGGRCLPGRNTAQSQIILGFQLGSFTHADDREAADRETGRRDDVQRGAHFSGKVFRARRAGNHRFRPTKHLERTGTKFKGVVAKHHQDALGGRPQGRKSKLEFIRHRVVSGCEGSMWFMFACGRSST